MIVDTEKLFFEKQRAALAALASFDVDQVVYGGAAGGGKSLVGCAWQILRRLAYPGTRGLIGRSKLNTLKTTTLRTFFETAKRDFGMKANVHYTFNGQSNIITFYNGSEIFLKDLFAYPSDPEFDSLGSLEITDAFIDEIPQVSFKAWNIVRSRCRYKLDEFGITGTVLGTCNPAKGWVYNEFYKPSTEGRLKQGRAFIQSLPTDNPHLPKSYIETMKSLPEAQRKRLLEGNWDYDDSIDRMFNYDDLLRMFRDERIGDDKYITADIARFGKDKTVIASWEGMTLVEMVEMSSNSIPEAVAEIRTMQEKHGVRLSNIVVDGDGIGGGVVDIMKCRDFVGSGRPLHNKNCKNLRAEGYFKLAELVESNLMTILVESKREDIMKELDATRRHKPDLDGKLQVISKDQIKIANGGKSPDYADAIMMRTFFELRPNYGQYGIG